MKSINGKFSNKNRFTLNHTSMSQISNHPLDIPNNNNNNNKKVSLSKFNPLSKKKFFFSSPIVRKYVCVCVCENSYVTL